MDFGRELVEQALREDIAGFGYFFEDADVDLRPSPDTDHPT